MARLGSFSARYGGKIVLGILSGLAFSLGLASAQAVDIRFDGDQNLMTAHRFQRRLWAASDGTYGLVIQRGSVGNPGETGLVFLRSIDDGRTWSFVAQIDSNVYAVADGIIDGDNAVRLVVSTIKEGAHAKYDVRFLLLNYDGGNRSWAVARENTVYDATDTTAGSVASIARDSCNRLWVSFRYYNSADYWIIVAHSDDDGITWAGSPASFGTRNASSNKYGKVIAFSGNIGLVYHDFDGSNNSKEWAYRNDLDSEAAPWSRSPIAPVSNDEPRGCHFSVAVDDGGTVHLVYANHEYAILYQRYSGSWSPPVSLYSGTSNYPNITTNGRDLWVVFMEHVACAQSRIVYRTYSGATASWDDNLYRLSDSSERAFDTKVVSSPFEIGNATYLGLSERFDHIAFVVTKGTMAGSVAYEYWNGDAWLPLPVLQEFNADFRFPGYGFLRFEEPGDWQMTYAPKGTTASFLVRLVVTSGYVTNPGVSSMSSMKTNRRPSVPERSGAVLPVVWQEGALAPYRVIYNAIGTAP